MTIFTLGSKFKYVGFTLLLFFSYAHAGVEVIGINIFERREFEPPRFKGGRIYSLEKIYEYFEAKKISCEGGEADLSYEVLVYVVNATNEPLAAANVSLSEVLIGDGAEFMGKQRRLDAGSFAPGEAKLLRAAWSLDYSGAFDGVLERDFNTLYIKLSAMSATGGLSTNVPLIICQ